MKKLFLSMALLLGLALTAYSEASYVLRESFEGGQLPEGWTQEYVTGQQDWVIESKDLTYPAGAADGTCRIALRNTSQQTIGYTTRLVTPVLDLSEVYQPILLFQHAQQQRTGDFDQLRVLYRSGADRDWVELRAFDKKIATWQQDTIELDAASKTYQIAFEVTDNFGRGVVLDDICVRSMPTCTDPTNLTVEGLTTSAFRLRWNGSLDTDSFEILVNKSPLDPDVVDEDALWMRRWVNPTKDGFLFETGDILARNTYYYVYLRAHCAGELSQWVSDTIRTKNIVNVPYFLDFNTWPHTPGSVMGVESYYWTKGTDTQSNASPFININEEPGAAATKQKSPDGTHCLVFAGGNGTDKPIPAGSYVYGATPELNVENVKDLMVSFIGTAYQYYDKYNSKEWAGGLIVGVMTDPADIETFVAVDTVWAKGSQIYGYYQVPLSKYEGNGKYVAFLSRFDKQNLFFIDNLSIATQQDYPLLPTFEFSVTDGNTITVTPDIHGATSWDLIIAAQGDALSLTPDSSKILYTKTGITEASFTAVDDTLIDTGIQIYVRANGVYSLPERTLMPEKLTTFPRLLTFKTANNKHKVIEMASNWIYTLNSASLPEGTLWKFDNNKKFGNPYATNSTSTTSISGYSDAYYTYLSNSYKKGEEKEIYMALPAVEDVKKVQLSFYMSGAASYPDATKIAIGVMSDPYDLSTFVALDTVIGETARYNQYMATFEKYNGNGKFIAFLGVPPDSLDNSSTSKTATYVYFDDITIDELAGCKAASGIQKQVSDTSFILNWAASGASKWNVKLYSNAVEKKIREAVYQYTADEADLIESKDITTPTYEKKSLKPHTEYYYQVTTYCGEDTIEGAINLVKTDCAYDGEALPYVEGFEGYQNVGSQVQKIANCWTTKFVGYAYSSSPTTYSPYISSPSTFGHSGSGYLSFSHSSTSQKAWVGLPKMNVDSVKRLQVSFWMKGNATTYDDKIAVGVLTDPSDTSTFVSVDTIVVKGNDWEEFIVPLNKYEGKGEYICIKKTVNDQHYYSIDDVKVKMLSNCGGKVSGIEATRMDTATAFKWTAQDVDGYELLIAKEVIEDMENIDASKVLLRKQVATYIDTVPNSSAAFASNTEYYAYVRTYCSASNTGEWSNVISFKTACMPETPESFGVEDFTSAERFDCWTPGLNIVQKAGGNPTMTSKLMPAATPNYLYLNDAKFTTTANKEKGGQSYVIMPTLNVDSIKDVEITFQAHCGSTATYKGILDIGVCVDDFDSYIKVGTVELKPVTSVAAAANYGFNEAPYYTVRLTDYVGDAEGNFGKKIVLLSRGNADANNYCYIKNLSVRRLVDLNEPINVTIPDSTIEVGQAIVNWDAQEGATGYDIKYATAEIDPNMDTVLVAGTDVTIKTVTSATNTVTLTELPGLTMYYVYVRSTNAEGKSIWSNMRSFKSSCPVAFELPYEQNFDSYNSGFSYYPECWERYYTPASATSTTATACVYSSAKNGTSGNGLYVGSIQKYGPSYFALPKMEKAVKELMISFVYKSNAKTSPATTSAGPNRYMAIGVASDVSSAEKIKETVVWMDTIISTNNTSFTDYTFAFDKYAGTGEYIIFCGYGGTDARTTAGGSVVSTTNTSVGGLYIDDLLIEKIPTCFPATIEQITSTTSSITVAISDNFNQTTWDIAFVPQGGKLEEVTPITVNIKDTIEGGYFEVTDLAHSTTFDVYVRANCGGGDVSKWSKPVAMNTLFKSSIANAHWDFEYTADERANYLVLSPKATSTSYLTDPKFVEGNANKDATYSYYPYLQPGSVPTSETAAMYGYKSDFSMRLYSYSSSASYGTNWFALPEIDGNLDTLQIRFDATAAYISNRSTMALSNSTAKGTYKHSVKVGVMEDPNDWKTFTELSEFVFPEVTATTADDDQSHWNHYTLNLFGAEAKGKYITFATDYKVNNTAYIDNIVVEAQTGCGAPAGLNVVDSTLTATTAEVVWVSNKLKWNLQVLEQVDDTTTQVVVDSIVTAAAMQYETKVAVENLKPNTKYTLRVKTICGEEDESEVSEKGFTTPCAAYTVEESVWNFEDNLYQYGSSTSYLIPECWEVGGRYLTISTGVVADETTQSNMPYAIANTSSYLYAQGSVETTAKALRFYNNSSSTTIRESWAVMPALAKTDGMQLHFWGRAGYFSKSTKKAYAANTNYAKKLYFGTFENDKFTRLDSVQYTHALTTSNLYTEDEDEFWQEYLVPLDKFNGKKVVIYTVGDNKAASYFFIDNLEVLPDNYCFRPTGLKSDSVYSDRAQITWRKANRAVEIQLATAEDFAEESIVLDSLAAADVNVLNLTDLPTETKLYLRARSVCGENEKSDWVNGGSFLTLAKPLFRETFSELRLFPEGWTRYSKLLLNVVDTIANQIGTPVSTTVTTNWYRYPSAIGLPASHLKDNIYASSHNTWIVSKQIDLTSFGENDLIGLSFDLAMTDGKEHKGAEPDRLTGYDDAFVVAISLDNAATWKSEDLTVWANQPFAVHVDATTKDTTYVEPKYVYNQISSKFGGERIFIDLSKYAGKIINFAFYGESTKANADNDVHIDNVQINTYSLNQYEETICRWEDYEDNNFNISVEEYNVDSTTTYELYTTGNVVGADRLNRLKLTVTADQRTERDITLCEGTTYQEDNFNFVAEKSGRIQQKLACANGCDSVSALNVTVIPKIYEDTVVSICHGKYVDFCGQQYYTSGNYECTFTSERTGCDSIVRLHLTVREIIRGENQVYLCPNSEIEFGDTTITTPGVYSRIIDADGCDSLATLTVIEAQSDSVILRAAIAQGDVYSKDPWRGLSLAGDYPITTDNIYGCDSTTVLHLMVVPADGVLYDTITVNELPYILDGEVLLDEQTEAGTYSIPVTREEFNFTLQITVDYAQSLITPSVNSLQIAPNPAQVGEAIRVLGNFDNASIEVTSATGALVYTAQNLNNPITIPGMPAAGVYLIRLRENDRIYQAKLMVK